MHAMVLRRGVHSIAVLLLLGGFLLWWGHGTTAMGQDGPIHGTVQSSMDQTVTVELKTGYRVESGTKGTVWATKTTLGQETTVEQGKIRVKETDGRTVTAQIVEGTGLEEGQDVQFASVREVGTIVVDVQQPEKATVYLDQERVGQGDVRRTVDVGLYNLRVAASGYDTEKRPIEVKRGKTQSESFTLDRSMGRLTVTTKPSSAQLEFREGEYSNYTEIGRTPVQEEELPPGDYDLRVTKDGYQTITEEVGIQAGELTLKSYTLEKAAATLVVTSDPSGAKVYVGDEYLGRTRLEAQVEPGNYNIKVGKDGYGTKSEYKQLAAGKEESVYFELEERVTSDTYNSDDSNGSSSKGPTLSGAFWATAVGAGIGALAASSKDEVGSSAATGGGLFLVLYLLGSQS